MGQLGPWSSDSWGVVVNMALYRSFNYVWVRGEVNCIAVALLETDLSTLSAGIKQSMHKTTGAVETPKSMKGLGPAVGRICQNLQGFGLHLDSTQHSGA